MPPQPPIRVIKNIIFARVMEIYPVGEKAAPRGEEASLGERLMEGGEAVVVNPCNESTITGGRLMEFKRAWMFNQWAFSIVSKGLDWQWLRVPSPVK